MNKEKSFSRLFTRIFLQVLEVGIVSVVPTITIFRLGNMDLDGMPAAAAGGLALLTALTSLLFNRARAYKDGRVQRRSLLAAELGLRALIFAAGGVCVAAFLFPFLAQSYATTPWQRAPVHLLPTISAMVVSAFFLRAAFLLLFLGRVISPVLASPLKAQHVTRRSG